MWKPNDSAMIGSPDLSRIFTLLTPFSSEIIIGITPLLYDAVMGW